jgi:hypothetical protein
MPAEVCDPVLQRWLELIEAEYREMPGLSLTEPQFQRLWNLDPDSCNALIAALESSHFLRRTNRDELVLAESMP